MQIRKILSLFKTIRFNFYYFPLRDAIKLPIYVSYDTKILMWGGGKGSIHLEKIKRGIVSIGIDNGSFALGTARKSCISIANNTNICFNGRASFARGINLIVEDNAELIIQDNFYCNAMCLINASKKVNIGKNVLMGWNCTILDGDGHSIYLKGNSNNIINELREVNIMDNVWIASGVTILKGVTIGNGNVIASGSIVTKSFLEEHIIIGGAGCRILKQDIDWIC